MESILDATRPVVAHRAGNRPRAPEVSCSAPYYWDGRGPIYWSGESNRIHQGLDLRGADLRQANLRRLPLAFTRGGLFLDEWLNATEEQRNMAAVLMSESDLSGVHLERAILRGAHLENASLREANLEGSILAEAYLNRTALLGASLSDQRHIGPVVADTNWGNVNLAVVKWSSMKMLSDEYEALQKEHDGKIKDKVTRLDENEKAVRANRQLAVALEAQGLNEDAARFAYRAQKLQRIVLRRQRNFGSYLFSCFLDLLVGYGYRPRRSLLWYLVTVFVFAVAYFAFGHLPLFPDSLVLSLTSFHGRGFFLLIEISFIATFTQRFLGK